MDKVIAEYINQVELGDMQEYKGMSVFPIYNGGEDFNYITLKEALNANLLTVTEVDDSGSVPELKVVNKADVPVLLMDGEELTGAKQNRVLNTTILLKQNSETVIPVSCTEQGRWSYNSPNFAESGNVAAYRVRRSKSVSVNESLRMRGDFRSNQGEVWNEIDNMAMHANVKSKTGAMRDIYQSRMKDLDKYGESFPAMEGQKGIMVMVNGEVMGLDMISSSNAYSLLHQKLLKSYAMEALLLEAESNGTSNGLNKAKLFLEEVQTIEDEEHKSVGYGCDHRLEGPSVVGSSLTYKDQVIHAAFFRTLDSKKERMSSYRKRRSFRM